MRKLKLTQLAFTLLEAETHIKSVSIIRKRFFYVNYTKDQTECPSDKVVTIEMPENFKDHVPV